MTKQILGIFLIFIGSISIGNFISHHTTVPINDPSSHALIGLLCIVGGVFLMKSKFRLDGWTHFKDE